MDRRHQTRLAEIAEREVQGERHIRLLAPLAFLSPRIIAAIVDGTAPSDLTVTGLIVDCGEKLGRDRRRLLVTSSGGFDQAHSLSAQSSILAARR
jgi:hypothetical protein